MMISEMIIIIDTSLNIHHSKLLGRESEPRNALGGIVLTLTHQGDHNTLLMVPHPLAPPRLFLFFPRVHKKNKRDGNPREGPEAGRRYGTKKKEGIKDVGIFNLSKVTLSENEKFVLNHGLKYATDKPLRKFGAFIDV